MLKNYTSRLYLKDSLIQHHIPQFLTQQMTRIVSCRRRGYCWEKSFFGFNAVIDFSTETFFQIIVSILENSIWLSLLGCGLHPLDVFGPAFGHSCRHSHVPDCCQSVFAPFERLQIRDGWSLQRDRGSFQDALRGLRGMGTFGKYILYQMIKGPAVSSWKYQFLYDQSSRVTLISVTTWMGDSCSTVVWMLLLTLRVGKKTGCWLCVDTELAIGQCSLGPCTEECMF